MVTSRGERGGFALVAALWLLVATAAVAATLEAVAVAERRAAVNNQEAAEARWAARGAIARALAHMDQVLARRGRVGRVADSLLGTTRYTVGGRTVQVRVDDPRARVNVNRASASQLIGLFSAIGMAPGPAAQLVEGVIASRTPGTAAIAPTGGGSPFPPLGRPFGEVEEAVTAPAMTPQRFRLVAPGLTVVGDGRVNVNLAPLVVLRALPGVDSAAAIAIAAHRAARPFHNAFEVAGVLGPDSRARLQRRFAAFVDETAFTPRDLVLTATTNGLRGKVSAIVRLEGGAAWSVVGVVVR